MKVLYCPIIFKSMYDTRKDADSPELMSQGIAERNILYTRYLFSYSDKTKAASCFPDHKSLATITGIHKTASLQWLLLLNLSQWKTSWT